MIYLPWPPSVNTIWRRVMIGNKPRTLLSKEGREWYAHAAWAISRSDEAQELDPHARYRVEIEAHPPDKRRRDLDNVLKPILDGCTKSGLWDDDSQVDDLRIWRPSAQDLQVVRICVGEEK